MSLDSFFLSSDIHILAAYFVLEKAFIGAGVILLIIALGFFAKV